VGDAEGGHRRGGPVMKVFEFRIDGKSIRVKDLYEKGYKGKLNEVRLLGKTYKVIHE
jgi:hypothetical protein